MTNRLAPAAFAALLCLPAAAFAQTSQAPAAAPPAMAPPAASSTGAAAPHAAATAPAMNKDIQAKVDQHITQLHAQLKITAAQEPQWKQFADVMRDNARDMDGVVQERTQQLGSMNALQNMQSYAKLAQAHAEHLQKLVSAFETLYTSLPQQQQQFADQVFRARIPNQPQHASAAGHTRTE